METDHDLSWHPPPLAKRLVNQWYDQLQFRDTIQNPDDGHVDVGEHYMAPPSVPADGRVGQVSQDSHLRVVGERYPHASMPSMWGTTKPDQMDNTLTIGGIRFQNPAIVIDNGQGRFADLPVRIPYGHGAQAGPGVLVIGKASIGHEVQPLELHFSDSSLEMAPTNLSSGQSLMGYASPSINSPFITPPLFPPPFFTSPYSASPFLEEKDSFKVTTSSYILRGDVSNLFGIRNLHGQMYSHYDLAQSFSATERVTVNTNDLTTTLKWPQFISAIGFSPLKDLPVKAFNFTCDESPEASLSKPGLRVETDVEFKGSLKPIADILHMVFGNDPKQEIPTSMRLSAHLQEKNDNRWAAVPQPSSLSLTGKVIISLWISDYLQFTELGAFVSMSRSVEDFDGRRKRGATPLETGDQKPAKRRRMDDPSHYHDEDQIVRGRTHEQSDAVEIGDAQVTLDKAGVAFGFSGDLNIHNLPGTAKVPLRARYKITRHWFEGPWYPLAKMSEAHLDPNWRTTLTAVVGEWSGAFGFKHLNIHSIEFEKSWDEVGDRRLERPMLLAAKMKLGHIEIDVSGEFLEGDTSISGSIENLKWSDIITIYHELFGGEIQPDTEGNELTFADAVIDINNDGFAVHTEIAFNGYTTAFASISFDEDGIHIRGDLESDTSGLAKPFQLPGTDITVNKGHLDIYIGRNAPSDAGTTGRTISSVEEIAAQKEAVLVDSSKPGVQSKRRQPLSIAKRKSFVAPSRFAIGGEIEFYGATVAVGLIFSSGAAKERQWTLYGSHTGTLKTSHIAPALAGTWLDIELSDVRVIVSSDGLEAGTGLIPVEYSVSKGLNVCATLASVNQINMLSGSREKAVRFVACVSSAEPQMSLHMPSSFVVKLSEAAQLRDLQVAVQVSKSPALSLGGNLYLTLQQQRNPLIFKIALEAGMFEVSGSIRCDSIWRNPFGISDRVEIRRMAGDLAFLYSGTPSKFAINAAGSAGKLSAAVAFGVSTFPNEQVVEFDMAGLHIGSIIELIGDIHDIDVLKRCGKADFLIFAKAHLYFSTGGTIATKRYPAGISASGRLVLFGKTAEFEASATEDGIKFWGAVDKFELGPLKVTSADGGPRAELRLEAGKEEQSLFINGMISVYGLSLKVLIKASLRPFSLDAVVSIDLGGILKFDLEARVKNIQGKDLSNAEIYFRAQLEGDPFGKFCDAIVNFFDNVQKLTDYTIDSMELKLVELRREVYEKRKTAQRRLKRRRKELELVERDRKDTYARETAKANAARAELARLEKVVADANGRMSEVVKEANEKIRLAKKRWHEELEKKRSEYDRELRDARKERERLLQEKEAVENRKRVRFGDAIRDLERAQKDVNVLQDEWNRLHLRVRDLERWRDEAFWPWDKAVKGTVVARDACGTSKDIAMWTLDRCKEVVWSTERMGLERMINNIAEELIKIGEAIAKLVTEGVQSFIERLTRNEQAEIDREQRYLDELLDGNSDYIRALESAKASLNQAKPGLDNTISQCEWNLAKARDEKGLKKLEAEARKLESEEQTLNERADDIEGTLEFIRSGVHLTTDVVKKVVEGAKYVTIRVTKVVVEVDATDLKHGGKFNFGVTLTMTGREFTVSVGWDPTQSAQELFAGVVAKAVEN